MWILCCRTRWWGWSAFVVIRILWSYFLRFYLLVLMDSGKSSGCSLGWYCKSSSWQVSFWRRTSKFAIHNFEAARSFRELARSTSSGNTFFILSFIYFQAFRKQKAASKLSRCLFLWMTSLSSVAKQFLWLPSRIISSRFWILCLGLQRAV